MTYRVIYKLKSDLLHILYGSIEADTLEEAVECFPRYMDPIELLSVYLPSLIVARTDYTDRGRKK
jgi:hypothetical protein